MKKIYFFLVLLFTVNGVWGQTVGDYRSTATGNWNAIATWERYNGASWVAAGVTPTSADGVITIRSPHVVTISAAGLSYDQVVVDAGGQVTVAATITHTLANGTGTDLTINGTWLNSGGTWTVTGASWAVGSGGTFIHNTTSGIATPLGVATLDPASNFIYRGNSTPLVPAISYSGRTFGNLTFESSSGSWSSATLSGSTASSCTNYTIGSGVTLNVTYTGVFTINGNYTNNGTLAYGAGTQIFTFTGSGKTISGSGAITFETLNINGGASITANNAITVLSTFTGTVTGTLATDATLTNSGTLNVNGVFQLNQGGSLSGTSPIYGSSSTLIYAGTSTQTTAATEFPAASGPNSLTINNAAGVTFPAAFNRTINGSVNLISGSLSFGAGASLAYGASGVLKYNGSSAQTSTDAEFPSASGPFSLEINNGSGVTLHATRTLNGNLTLTSGILTLGANDLIVSGTLTGGSSTSYIKTNSTGSFTLNSIGAGPVLIPVGNNTYNSLSFTNGSGLNWTIRVEDAVNNVVLPFTTDKAINRTWHISPSAPVVTGPDVTFNFDDADASQLFNPAAYSGDPIRTAQVWHYTGTQWLAATGFLTMTPSAGPQSLTLSGYTYYSPFAISKSSGPLPVKFTNVRAYQQGSAIKIDWSNLTESNVLNYVVERSANVSSFIALNTISASRHDGGRADYTSLDVSPLNGVNFYRIRSNELDGKSLYSVIVKVNTKAVVAGITIYPNPITGGQVSLQTTGLSKGLYTVRIFDAGGQQVFNQLMNHNGGAATEVIQLPAALKPGMYSLQLNGGEVKLAKSFIIK